MFKRLLKILAVIGVLLVLVMAGAAYWMNGRLNGSLPQLEGTVVVEGVSAPVTIERDSLGIPTIRGENRIDVAFATGYVHAQDRFFQMDLLRRNSAGELSELFGSAALDNDKKMRVYRFRNVSEKLVAASEDNQKALLKAYADGVNAGLAALKSPPFEYLLLGLTPTPWKPEDSGLVMFSMYLDLQGEDFHDERLLGTMHDTLPEPMFNFLAPLGTEWDAPIDGEAFAMPPTPGADVYDTRKTSKAEQAWLSPAAQLPLVGRPHLGSNNWAVSGKRTKDGRALMADDMHLGIRVPHVWYRASLEWKSADGGDKPLKMTGASLPGTPAVVVGSNGHVAWGFTNAEGDWVDVVTVEVDEQDKESYKTPDGPKKFEHNEETIVVNGAADETLDVVSTIWGPILAHDHKKRPQAIHWVALEPGGANMGLLDIENATTLDEALRLANLSGSPAQNFVVADDQGHIAWTILGRIPRRVGWDGRLPSSWADGSHRWDGWLKPEEYPKVVNPESGQIWTANARVVSGEMLAKLGDGGYDLGARAKQIRDDLTKLTDATEADMLKVQLDDQAIFLTRWQQLLLEVLSPAAVEKDHRRGELRKLVEEWGGEASTESVGFRAVRTFRRRLITQLADALTIPCKQADKDFAIGRLDRTEGPVWSLVTERPAHLIDPNFKTWDELFLAAADRVVAEATKDGAALKDFTWGNYNTTRIIHPMSPFLPSLATWLNMSAQQLPGDSENMPRIQAPAMGASQRMGVSPGRESEGYFHMPCGQSGHPMSPHYRDSHPAWVEGRPTPFLPGPAEHTLVLKPAGKETAVAAKGAD
jgi:penicillin amidase